MAVFIHKGDPPLTVRQAEKRGLHILDLEAKPYEREAGAALNDPDYQLWVKMWLHDNEINAANNLFNHQLAAYRKATARLAQYRLADGRPELTEERETDERDEEGNPVMETVVVSAAIEPLPAEIEQPVHDPETGKQTGVEKVPNPAIVQDDAERAAARAIVDNTPQEVKDFDTGRERE